MKKNMYKNYVYEYLHVLHVGQQGSGTYLIQASKRNSTEYISPDKMRRTDGYHAAFNFIKRVYTAFGEREPTRLVVLRAGVKLNGRWWSENTPCLYRKLDGSGRFCGIVTSMLKWENEAEKYLLFRVQPYRLVSISKLCAACQVSKQPLNVPPVWLAWSQMTHYCRKVPSLDSTNITFVVVQASDPTEDSSLASRVKTSAPSSGIMR